jgi:uncharacterized protein YndB with AHSA1/START domain
MERLYDAPAAVVWRALTESRLVALWLMENDFEPRVGHHFTLRSKPNFVWDGIVRGEVLEVVENQRLRYTWKGAPKMPETVVSWEISRQDGKTRLAMSHTGFSGLKYTLIGFGLERGWRSMLDRSFPRVLDQLS